MMVPIPAEFKGLARVFINRCLAAHHPHVNMMHSFEHTLTERARRHRDRGIPGHMLQDIGREWKAYADPFRIAFINNIRNSRGSICEGRISPNKVVCDDWGTEKELTILLAFHSLLVTRKLWQTTIRFSHSFSLHALARLYERSGIRSDSEVIGAIVSTLAVDPGEHDYGSDVSCGNWRGLVVPCEYGTNKLKIWSARTWIDK